MIQLRRATSPSKIALLLVCLLGSLLGPVAGALAEEGTVVYKKESLKQYEQQLSSGQVQAVTINKRLRSLRLTLKDGRHVLAKYAAHQEPQVAANLKAKGVAVTVLSKTLAVQEATKPKPVHHKLRYIAGGILLVVIIVVGAVLYFYRRRRLQRG
ncbi:MAG: hypothetical protein ABSG95_08190 [Solirubrobacteraceae bacterium]|jgi:hypothetical protein